MIDSLESRRHFAATGLDPTFGQAGTARIAIAETGDNKALFSDVVAGGFSASGAGYVEVRQENKPPPATEADHYDRYLAYHVLADGTFDTAFGTDGRVELKTPGEFGSFPTFAVSPTGRLVASDSKYLYHLYDSDGQEQFGASHRLTRTINRLRDAPSLSSFGKVQFSETAAFDNEGRLLIPGEYTEVGKQHAIALFRFTTNGLLDTTFGNVGRAFTHLAFDGINYSTTQLAVGRDGQIVFTTSQLPEITPPAGATTYYTPFEIAQATVSPDGVLLGHGAYVQNPVPVSTEPIGNSANLDLRPLADGTIASLAYTADVRKLAIVHEDGTVTAEPVKGRLQSPTRITPAGTIRGYVGPRANNRYRPPEGSTDEYVPIYFNALEPYAVLGDGSLIAAGVDRKADTPSFLVQKFDGTGLTTPATSASARYDPVTRTLDVQGTRRSDEITIRLTDGRLRVRVNGTIQTFAASDVDTLHVAANAGNDTISVNVGRANLAVRLRGGSGDDVLQTDAYRARIDGGDGDDVGTLTPGSELNAVGIEALRHPGRLG